MPLLYCIASNYVLGPVSNGVERKLGSSYRKSHYTEERHLGVGLVARNKCCFRLQVKGEVREVDLATKLGRIDSYTPAFLAMKLGQ